MVKRRTIAVIPARGGSTRIPGKNIVDFFDKPLIAWTIEAAMECGAFHRVLVSTDDPEIAQTARACGAEAPFLRDRHASDHSPVALATLHALSQYREVMGEEFETVVQLMPNCPLRRAEHIVAALEHFAAIRACFQISCARFGWINPWWALRLDRESHPDFLFPDAIERRSQDLEPLYFPSGAIWIAQREALTQAGTFYGEGCVFHSMDWTAAVDIDTKEDLDFAKAVYLMIQSQASRVTAATSS